MTGLLKNFKAKDGKWSALVHFDDKGTNHTLNGYEDDEFTLTGTYDEESAECTLKPAPHNKDTLVSQWTLHKTGDAHE